MLQRDTEAGTNLIATYSNIFCVKRENKWETSVRSCGQDHPEWETSVKSCDPDHPSVKKKFCGKTTNQLAFAVFCWTCSLELATQPSSSRGNWHSLSECSVPTLSEFGVKRKHDQRIIMNPRRKLASIFHFHVHQKVCSVRS